MIFRKLLLPLILFSFVVLLASCKSGNLQQPSNPFAQNLMVPPLATFSSQESFLGQTPGSFVPQTPASTFAPTEIVTPPSAPAPANLPFSNTTNNNTSEQGATLFTATVKETNWVPIDVASTHQTAFQAMNAKVNSANAVGSLQTNDSESLIVGTSPVVTTIVDNSPSAPLTEPQTLQLYSGGQLPNESAN